MKPSGGGQPVLLRRAVDVAQPAPGLDGRGPRLRVDSDAAQARHVERQAPVGERGARDVVAAAAHRQQQAVLAGEADRRDDVGRPVGWTTSAGRVDHAVPEPRRRRRSPAHREGSRRRGRARAGPRRPRRGGGGHAASVPMRGAQRGDERLRPLDRRVVGAVLDHVQRPAVAALAASATSSRVARSWRPQMSVVGTAIRASSPGRSGARRLLHRRAERDLHARACGRARGCRPGTAPSAASARAGRRGRARNAARARRASAPRARRGSRAARARTRAPERTRVSPSRRPARAGDPVAVGGGEAGRDRAAEGVADERRRRRAGGARSAPPATRGRARRRARRRRPRRPEAGQVGRDHAVRRDESGDDLQPVGGVRARAVQQDQRRAVAALQHRGRDAGQLQPPLAPPRYRPAGSRACCVAIGGLLVVAMPTTLSAPARRRIRETTQPRCAAAWVVPPTGRRQTSPCSYA